MLKWLNKKQLLGEDSPPLAPDAALLDNWVSPLSAESLLGTPLRQRLIRLIWQRTSIPDHMFRQLILGPIQNFATLVQLLPASQYHHHAYYGGMLDHGLEVAGYAAKIRQNHLLPPGAPPEEQAEQAEAWTAAAIYAALMHDIGKLIVDIEVEQLSGKIWYPWHGSINQPWCLRYRPDRNYRLHPAAGGLVCLEILTPDVMDWMVSHQAVFAPLLCCISGHYEQAGLLGDIISKADQASVAQNLGGNPTKVFQQPKCSLPKQILVALRYLLQHTLRLNNPQGGSDGWLTEEALWLVCKTTADHIRAHLLQLGITGVPDSNSRLFDEMQSHGIATPCNDKIIWRSKITAQSGWSTTLTLLRIPPALIWENVNQRPPLFSGCIELDEGPIQTVKSETMESGQDFEGLNNSQTDFIYHEYTVMKHPSQKNDKDGDIENKKPSNIIDSSQISNNHVESKITSTTSTKEKQDVDEKIKDGHLFFSWICDKVYNNLLPINVSDAKIHLVCGCVFLVSPGIFKLYVKEMTGAEEQHDIWRIVQKNFQKMNVHRKKKMDLIFGNV